MLLFSPLVLSLLPLKDGKTISYYLQGARKESVGVLFYFIYLFIYFKNLHDRCIDKVEVTTLKMSPTITSIMERKLKLHDATIYIQLILIDLMMNVVDKVRNH